MEAEPGASLPGRRAHATPPAIVTARVRRRQPAAAKRAGPRLWTARGHARAAASLLFVDLETTGPGGRRRQLCVPRRLRVVRAAAVSRPPVPAVELCVRARAARSGGGPRRDGGHRRHLQRQVVRPPAHRDALRAEPVDDAVCRHAARRHAASRPAPLARTTTRAIVSARLETSLLGHEREGDVPDSRSPRATSTTCGPAMRGRSTRCSSTTGSTCCRWRCSRRGRRSCSTKESTAARTAREALGIGRSVRAVRDDVGRAGLLCESLRDGADNSARRHSTRTRCCCGERAASRRPRTPGSVCSNWMTARRG